MALLLRLAARWGSRLNFEVCSVNYHQPLHTVFINIHNLQYSLANAMSPSALPAAELSNLTKSDGSATFSYQGYTVTTAVNGPVEAQRRDEHAFEALVDVNVRPAAGVGGMVFSYYGSCGICG